MRACAPKLRVVENLARRLDKEQILVLKLGLQKRLEAAIERHLRCATVSRPHANDARTIATLRTRTLARSSSSAKTGRAVRSSVVERYLAVAPTSASGAAALLLLALLCERQGKHITRVDSFLR